MKREAVGHTKMKRLCRRLDIPLWQGVGLMESLWHLTARETPRGDIGKLSNEDIALAIDYRGDEDKLIEALCGAGWVDSDSEERLVIHDWHEHADDAVNMKLARSRQFFAGGIHPKISKLPFQEKQSAEQFYASCALNTETVRTGQQKMRTPEAPSDHASAHDVRTACVPPEPRQSPAPPEPEPEPFKNICASSDARVSGGSLENEPEKQNQFDLQSEPNPSRKKDSDGLTVEQGAWFDEWWTIYWLKVSKKPARKVFAKQVRDKAMFDLVVAATRAQAPDMLARESAKRPHGATWLTAERWNDEPRTPTVAPKAASPKSGWGEVSEEDYRSSPWRIA
jgi:hypothetical protein